MPAAIAASLIDSLLGLQFGSLEQDTGNRFCLDGLALAPASEGALEVAGRRLEATSLRMASGPFVLEVGRLALHQLAGHVRSQAGRLHWTDLQAASAELSGLKVQGPLLLPLQAKGGTPAAPAPGLAPASVTPGEAAASAWAFGPLADAAGTVRAKIVDAHLLFDADVTVPIRQGEVDFNQASVEHVGPDSRMGVSRLGLYVDAPNGRSYLFQFPSTPVGGVEYERRGALPGPWVADRGRLRLQPFAEGLLRQARAGHGFGVTEQARQLFDRTAVSGEVQLGDGRFTAPGVQADLAGRGGGRNLVRLHAEAVGRGVTVEMPSLTVGHAVLQAQGAQLACDEITGALVLRVFSERGQLHFAFELANLRLSGLRLQAASPR